MDAISGFKAGSAPGISGLRPHHLQQLTLAGNPHTTELLMQLDIFVQVCLEGKLTMTMAHVLGAASLVAMKKVKLSDVTDEMDEVQALQALQDWCRGTDLALVDLEEPEEQSAGAVRPIAIGDTWRRLVSK